MNEHQQMQQQTDQVPMQEAPAVITGKDLNYINDMMAWNLTAAKKAHSFAESCQDADIKAAIESAGQMHQRHYEQFLQLLNQQNGSQAYQ